MNKTISFKKLLIIVLILASIILIFKSGERSEINRRKRYTKGLADYQKQKFRDKAFTEARLALPEIVFSRVRDYINN